jgi:ADP-ribose pyrophosphatase YjhB (NUDIX family)
MERDETAEQAAAREVLEETGWAVKDAYPLMVNSNPGRPGEDRQNVSFVFVFAAVEKTGEADWESDEVKWFPLDALPPSETIAFDHTRYIDLYLKSQKESLNLPLVV